MSELARRVKVSREILYPRGTRTATRMRLDVVRGLCELAGWSSAKTLEAEISWLRERESTGALGAALQPIFACVERSTERESVWREAIPC